MHGSVWLRKQLKGTAWLSAVSIWKALHDCLQRPGLSAMEVAIK